MVSLDSVYWDLDALRGAKASNQRCVCVRRHLVRICKPCAHKKSHAFFVKDTASLGRAGLELNSQKTPQLLENKEVKDTPCPTPISEAVHNPVHISTFCPELQQIIDRWDILPEHIKEAIKSLIQTHVTE